MTSAGGMRLTWSVGGTTGHIFDHPVIIARHVINVHVSNASLRNQTSYRIHVYPQYLRPRPIISVSALEALIGCRPMRSAGGSGSRERRTRLQEGVVNVRRHRQIVSRLTWDGLVDVELRTKYSRSDVAKVTKSELGRIFYAQATLKCLGTLEVLYQLPNRPTPIHRGVLSRGLT